MTRYDTGVLLGEGGMGSVYRAYDADLRRPVALKFLRGNDPALYDRLLREARLQSQVDHEHVCKVYEVGLKGERPYVAMQYIEGETLDVAARRMSLEQKVRVIAEVADAVHAAHATGLIHRDLKPGNVMIETRADGWKPFVLDFGLAREHAAVGLTQTGLALGTPPYMAPEQARGESEGLDRRTDVYSLGAVLYELLVGRPPFEGKSALEVLVKVLQDEPAAPRALDPRVPRDLETVVLKCLEKEPQRRYESARAMATDLRRYLGGEPIEARPSTFLSRVAARLRKHRLATGSVAAAAAVAAVLLGLWLRSEWRSSERAGLAQRFGQEVERMEGTLRQAYLLPLHDTRREKALVRARMRAVEAEVARLGGVARGPGRYAVGRGHLALHEIDAAREDLEAAWQAGYRGPEVAYALGQALGASYRDRLAQIATVASVEARAARARELERRYRTPALAYLASAGKTSEPPAVYVEGLIAFYERRYDVARSKADEALVRDPGLYEARKLIGDAWLFEGSDEQDRGRLEPALAALRRAGEAYEAAATAARSDPSIYEADCQREIHAMEIEAQRGRSPRAEFERAIRECEAASRADPDASDAYNSEAWALWRWADDEREHGQDPRATLAQSIAKADAALRLAPGNASVRGTLANAYGLRAQFEMSHGIDPREDLRAAIAQGEQASRDDPASASARLGTGTSRSLLAEYEASRGVDPRPGLAAAIEDFGRAAALAPRLVEAHGNMGISHVVRAGYEASHGVDPRPSLRSALACFARSAELNPSNADVYSQIGEAHGMDAEYSAARGVDPRGALTAAAAGFDRAIALNPSSAIFLSNRGEVDRLRAEYEMAAGLDPRPSLASARRLLEKSLTLNRSYTNAAVNLARVQLDEALVLLDEEQAAANAVARARSAAAVALRLDPNDPVAHLTNGRIELAAARAALQTDGDPEPCFARARIALERALSLDGDDPEAAEALAELHLRRAQRRQGRHEPFGDDLRQGRALVDRVLASDAQRASAVALRGALLLAEARGIPDRAARSASARAAVASIETALRLNPLLARRQEAVAAEARRLAER